MTHPCHKAQLPKLNRAKGQVEAIGRMIEDGRYCVDIITQVQAARAALKSIELAMLQTHMSACVADALKQKDPAKKEEKLQEVTAILKKYL